MPFRELRNLWPSTVATCRMRVWYAVEFPEALDTGWENGFAYRVLQPFRTQALARWPIVHLGELVRLCARGWDVQGCEGRGNRESLMRRGPGGG